MTRIRGRRALVTGAAQGIGLGLARRLAAEGAELILVDKEPTLLEAAVEELAAKGHPVASFACDLSRRDAIETLRDEVRARHGSIGILVNNAGVAATGPYLALAPGVDQAMLDVNVAGLHWMTKAFLPDLQATGGHLVQMASAAGFLGVADMALYCASKWFVIGLSEALRAELRDQGAPVRMTIVCPGYVDTGLFDEVRSPRLMPLLQVDQVVDAVIEAVRADRLYVKIPPLVATAPILRSLLPRRAFDRVADWLGIHRSFGHGP